MPKSSILVLGLIVVAGGWFGLQKFEIEGLDRLRLAPRGVPGEQTASFDSDLGVPAESSETVRIATFNIQVFGESKAKKPAVMDLLARVVRQFDVVAIQEIRCKDQDLLPRFVDRINGTGRHYDYVIGERLGRTISKEQYAFVFDTATLEVDRSQLYTIDDPDDLMHREPLVGWFRVRGLPPEQAFTFTLVNVHTDPDETDIELDVLDNVFRAVRDDGRGEDDVIMLGDFNVDDRHLGQLGKVPSLVWVISGTPTNTRHTQQYDNIFFQQHATREFTGRSGIFDFMRQYNLTIDQALEVSDHLAIWAEFTAFEGGQPGRVAALPDLPTR